MAWCLSQAGAALSEPLPALITQLRSKGAWREGGRHETYSGQQAVRGNHSMTPTAASECCFAPLLCHLPSLAGTAAESFLRLILCMCLYVCVYVTNVR